MAKSGTTRRKWTRISEEFALKIATCVVENPHLVVKQVAAMHQVSIGAVYKALADHTVMHRTLKLRASTEAQETSESGDVPR